MRLEQAPLLRGFEYVQVPGVGPVVEIAGGFGNGATLLGKVNVITYRALAASARPDVETSDWGAVCGRTARTVRRGGASLPSPSYRVTEYRAGVLALNQQVAQVDDRRVGTGDVGRHHQ